MGAEHEAAASAPVEEPATAAVVAGSALAAFAPGRALDPRTALLLQRHAGNRAVSQMVARQTPPVPGIDTADDELDAMFERADREMRERTAAQTAAARVPLDEALRRHDGTAFLTALRGLSDADRGLLAGNAAFLADMRRAFHGVTLLRVSTLLRFGQRRPDHIVQLLTAIDDRDAGRVADILRARNELRDPDMLPGLREAVTAAFAGTPSAALLARILSEPLVGSRTGVSQSYRETHFEIPAGQTAYQLQVMGGTGAFSLERTATEVRVIVTIGLTETGGSGHLTPELIATWRSGIEANWNNRFEFSNGTATLPVVFVPLFDRRGNGDHQVTVAPLPPPSGRADQSNWHARMDGATAAHEFGHMLGNIDEYRLAAQASDIPASLGLDAATTAASNQAGLEAAEQAATGTSVQWAAPVAGQPGRTSSGIMGNQAGKAQGRNVATVLARFNSTMRQAGEAEFRIRVR